MNGALSVLFVICFLGMLLNLAFTICFILGLPRKRYALLMACSSPCLLFFSMFNFDNPSVFKFFLGLFAVDVLMVVVMRLFSKGKKLGYSSNASAELHRVDNMTGRAFELWCANLLKQNEFVNVEVTPESNDQGVDILAQKNGIKYAIQCKCYSSDLGNTPIQEVYTGKEIYHCHVGIVMTNRHFTQGAKVAAQATGTLLWDRDKLVELLANAKVK